MIRLMVFPNVMRDASSSLVAVALLGLLCGADPVAAQSRRAMLDVASSSVAVEATAARATPAVVEVFTTAYAPADEAAPSSSDLIRSRRGSGSGVIVDPTGFIVTNAHVVRGAQRLRVELPPAAAGTSILPPHGRLVPARLVGLDLETDFAVLKLEAEALPHLSFGDSDRLRLGQTVLAIGSPLGFHNSLSLGIVSALARQLAHESSMVYLQTDAAIAPGSSGGPLVDLDGRIVGINTLVASGPEGGAPLAFAAPSNIVRRVYEQIRQHGRVRRGDIGVRPQTLTPDLSTALGLPRDTGVVLSDVAPNSPAARAGLRPGDVVTALDGKAMENGRQFQVGLYRHFAGDVVSIAILRGDQPMVVPVAVAERLESLSGLTRLDPREHVVPRLGILGLTVSPRVASQLPPLRAESGVLVMSVTGAESSARNEGLVAGDVVHAVNSTPVADLPMLRRALDALPTDTPLALWIERDGVFRFVMASSE